MPNHSSSSAAEAPSPIHIVVGVGSGGSADTVIAAGKQLADALHAGWDAVHVNTPAGQRDAEVQAMLAEALSLAARLGGTVATVPAASVADGLALYLEDSSATHLVLGVGAPSRPFRRSLAEAMALRRPELAFHLIPASADSANPGLSLRVNAIPSGFPFAVASVALTLLLAWVLNRFAGVEFLSFLFLFPVIATAARRSTAGAVAAALLSALAFNVVFLAPRYALHAAAIQSWIMAAVLVAVAVYTGGLTATLRGRVALSERSAQENARVAAFALELTRAADWTATAQIICSQIGAIFDVHAIVVRKTADGHRIIAAAPASVRLDTLDEAALDLAWSHEEAVGSGTTMLAASNWQFRQLKTSLGMLAVLGLAREDGRDPVPAERAALLSTLTSQAALALERLHLEEQMRAAAPPETPAS